MIVNDNKIILSLPLRNTYSSQMELKIPKKKGGIINSTRF